MRERGLEDSIQTTWPENKGRVDPQRNTKRLNGIKATGQAKIAHVYRSKYTETQGGHAAAVGDTLTVLNNHSVSPQPEPAIE